MKQQTLDPSELDRSPNWKPNSDAGRERLSCFLPYAAGAYAKRRNYDLGPNDRSNISALSPWIRNRLLLETDVLSQVLKQHRFEDAEKFVQEVFWRGYYKGWLEQHPEVWLRYSASVNHQLDSIETDAGLAERYDQALSASTGIDCFDAWTKELKSTGYLHNHSRMWFASIWVFTLGLPWELGADFFLRHLLDGDPASNTCSWRWVAGLHTAGKTYLARASNIAKYTEQRFNPEGLLAKAGHALQEAPLSYQPLRFDSPDMKGLRLGLLITEDDCSAYRFDRDKQIVSGLALKGSTRRSRLPSSTLVNNFSAQAIESAVSCLAPTLTCPIESTEDADWKLSISDWVNANRLDGILIQRVTQGPVRQRLVEATHELAVPVIELTRLYDQLVWTQSKAGFFRLNKKIPTILKELGLQRGTD